MSEEECQAGPDDNRELVTQLYPCKIVSETDTHRSDPSKFLPDCALCQYNETSQFPLPQAEGCLSFFSHDGLLIMTVPLNLVVQLPSPRHHISRLVHCRNYLPKCACVPTRNDIDEEHKNPCSRQADPRMLVEDNTNVNDQVKINHCFDDGRKTGSRDDGYTKGDRSTLNDGSRLKTMDGPRNKNNDNANNAHERGHESCLWMCKYGEKCKYVHAKIIPGETGENREKSTFIAPSHDCEKQFSEPYCTFRPVHINYEWRAVEDVIYRRFSSTKYSTVFVKVEGFSTLVPASTILFNKSVENYLDNYVSSTATNMPAVQLSRCHRFHGHGFCDQAENCDGGAHVLTLIPSLNKSQFRWAKIDIKRKLKVFGVRSIK